MSLGLLMTILFNQGETLLATQELNTAHLYDQIQIIKMIFFTKKFINCGAFTHNQFQLFLKAMKDFYENINILS